MRHVSVSTLTLEAARRLACFSGLFHDVGKMTQHFQEKLKKSAVVRDLISHEWISAWVLGHMLERQTLHWEGFLAAWEDWERRLNGGAEALMRNPNAWHPLNEPKGLKDFESAALMVVATHHRLFSIGRRNDKNGQLHRQPPDVKVLSPTGNHLEPSITADTSVWHRPLAWKANKAEVRRWQALLQQGSSLLSAATVLETPSVSHWHKIGLIARACMVLADQHVSARVFSHEAEAADYPKKVIRANSAPCNQALTWHLQQVGNTAGDYVDFFGQHDLPSLSRSTRTSIHGKGGAAPRFAWQDSACAFIRQTRLVQPSPAAFLIFNVASTGAGKTRANVRMLEACRVSEDPLRVTAGFNLKALTLQTAQAYRQELGLQRDECACVIGDPLARALHAFEQQDDDNANPETFSSVGCDSEAFLSSLPAWVQAFDHKDDGHASATLFGAPVLVATMDYLVAAGDPTRQAHHAQALLRIAHSDLLIDEADSYDPEGLVAVLRVVQMAGMFGRNVVVSSATLSPVLAEQIEGAWQSGITMYQGGSACTLQTHTVLVSNQGSATGHQSLHKQEPFRGWYCETMAGLYPSSPDALVYRLCRIVPVTNKASLCATLADTCLKAHAYHAWPAQTQGRAVNVSIGVIRMANIDPLLEQADQLIGHLWPEDTVVKICPYHAREVAMRRYAKEHTLDGLLKRGADDQLSRHPLIAEQLAHMPAQAKHLMLIVLASPVEEVGRDHDFDWAVIEPSSMHAIIQLAGRVNRHRLQPVTMPNVFLLEKNVKKLDNKSWCFHHPGLQQIDKYEHDRPSTHLQTSAFQLMQPVEAGTADMFQAFALDAGLIFSPQRRCHFAVEDDKAIANILRDVPAFFTPDYEQWACDWFYVKYPLREQQHDETWQVHPLPNGKLQLQKYERNHAGSPWVTQHDQVIEKRLENESLQWLCPTLHEAKQVLHAQLEAMLGAGHLQIPDFLRLAQQFSLHRTGSAAVPEIHWAGVKK